MSDSDLLTIINGDLIAGEGLEITGSALSLAPRLLRLPELYQAALKGDLEAQGFMELFQVARDVLWVDEGLTPKDPRGLEDVENRIRVCEEFMETANHVRRMCPPGEWPEPTYTGSPWDPVEE